MSGRLQNKCILLTRPQHQLENLANLISTEAGDVVLFPTIEIESISVTSVAKNSFDNIQEYSHIIFIRRNAVKYAFASKLIDTDKLKKLHVIAVGVGTAEELAKHGLSDVVHTGVQANSEVLLEQPQLNSTAIKDANILIVRGTGGRELPAQHLSQRGAKLNYAEVYQRSLPVYGNKFLKDIWDNNCYAAAIVTSNDGLKNLIQLTPDEYRLNLFNTPLILMSERLLELAKQYGFVSRLHVTETQTDAGLFLALLDAIGD